MFFKFEQISSGLIEIYSNTDDTTGREEVLLLQIQNAESINHIMVRLLFDELNQNIRLLLFYFWIKIAKTFFLLFFQKIIVIYIFENIL